MATSVPIVELPALPDTFERFSGQAVAVPAENVTVTRMSGEFFKELWNVDVLEADKMEFTAVLSTGKTIITELDRFT